MFYDNFYVRQLKSLKFTKKTITFCEKYQKAFDGIKEISQLELSELVTIIFRMDEEKWAEAFSG